MRLALAMYNETKPSRCPVNCTPTRCVGKYSGSRTGATPRLALSKSSSLPPLSPPPRARSTPTDASDPVPLRGDDKGRRLRDKNSKRLPASASAPLLKPDEASSRRSSVEPAGETAGGTAAAGTSAELERARLLHALGAAARSKCLAHSG